MRASCSTSSSPFAPSSLASFLAHTEARNHLQSLLRSRFTLITGLRNFSACTTFSARNRFIPRPPPVVQKTGRASTQDGQRSARRRRDLPTWRDYDPEIGIPLPPGELDQATIAEIFGPDMHCDDGNHILRLMHYRRLSGSLIDVGVDFSRESGISPEMATKALEYIRTLDPAFDENEAGAVWAESEIMKVEQQYMARAERLGIYKRTDDSQADDSQPSVASSNIYGESALDQLRKANKARWMEEDRKKEEAKKQQEAERVAALKAEAKDNNPQVETKEESGKIFSPFDEIALAQPTQKAWLEPVERKPWVKYYEEQATIIKDNKIPNLSTLRRLGPSALVLLAVLAGCWMLEETYNPPPKSARMFPDVPPAIATLGAITAINLAVFIAWRIPPLWRTMNKTFQVTAAYPFAIGTLGAQFSHQGFRHLFVNMVMLWPFGWILHDDVGRGTFLAIYLACGTVGTYGSLAFNVLAKRWMNYSFGSSTAVIGTMAAACLVRANNNVTVLGYEIPDITGLTVLGMIAGFEILRAWRGKNTKIDYPGHLSGLATGVLAGFYVRSKTPATLMTRKEFTSVQSEESAD
ncbi:rhomboid-domain-containing protein, partial [Aureobasidium melanogenum]